MAVRGRDTYRREELAKIHVAKKDLNLSEETYRDIIWVASGNKADSSAKLDWQGRRAVLERMQELGWAPKPARKAGGSRTRRQANDPQSRMLRGLWIELHKLGAVRDPSEAALAHFGKRLTRVDDLSWYSNRDVTIVKKALEDWTIRAQEAGRA